MNKQKHNIMMDSCRAKQRFSIRKLTIGTASVLLGTFLFWGGTTTVQAAETTPQDTVILNKKVTPPATEEKSNNDTNATSGTKDESVATTPTSSSQSVNDNKSDASLHTSEEPAKGTVVSEKDSKADKGTNTDTSKAIVPADQKVSSTVQKDQTTNDNNEEKNTKEEASKNTNSLNNNKQTGESKSIDKNKKNVESNKSANLSNKNNKTDQTNTLNIKNEQKFDSEKIKKMLADDKSEVKVPTFSGTVWFDPEGKLDPANKRTPYKAGDTQEIKYRISTYGDSTIQNPQYLLLLPAGFKTDTFTWSDANAIKSTQDLGNVGPNGEQVFLVTTKTSPAWTGLFGTATMTVNEKYAGAYNYADMSYLPLISALYGDAKEGGEALAGAGSPTIHLTNGTDYHVAKSIYTLNEKQWSEAGGSESYTILPGKKAITSDHFEVTDANVDLHPGDTTNSGYEQLNAGIKLTHHVEDGDYLDFHLGLPLQDGKTLPYDNQLSDGFDAKYQGTTIGHVFKMDNYYRLVFNTAVNQFFGNSGSAFEDTIHLRWNSGKADPSIKKPASTTDHDYGKTFVYQYTADKSKNQETFAYKPTNDVNIGGKVSASGLTIGGQYIYRGNILQVNKVNSASVSYSTNRTWDKNNNVQIDTNWYNQEQVFITTKAKDPSKSASNNFSITVVAGQNPYLTYNWASDADLANQIKNIFAHYHTHELSNPIADNNNILTQDKDTKGAQLADGDVTVTHEDKVENGVVVTRTYHVKISNPEVELDGAVSPLSVSASGFTMPDTIKNYGEDIANAAANKKGNFGSANNQSANTSNETLKKALEDTDTIKIGISNESGATAKNVSGVLGSPWVAGIGYSGSNLGPNGDDPSNYITTKLIFKDVDSGDTVGPSDGFTFQGKSGTAISFNGVEQELADLVNQGYSVDHVSSKSGNTETPISPSGSADKNKISSYNFGSISTASATPDEFIVYLKAQPQSELTDTKKVNETINYVFQDEHGNVISSTSREPYSKDLTFNGSRADKNDQFTYPHDKQNFDAVTIAPQTGFDLISAQDAAGNNVLDGKKVKAFNDINHKHADIKITVVFKAQPQSELTDTKKVNETINYVFQDEHGNVISSTSREPYSKDLTFNGSRADKNDQFTYPHDKQNFDAVTIAPQTGFDLISAQDAAGNNVLDGKKVKAFNDINHKHADIKITVVFKAQPQSELTDTKKVNETINYVFQDEHGNVISSTSREPYSKDLTFNGSRADKNDQFTYPHDKQNFDAVTIAPQTGFDLISAQDAAGNNVLDGKKVKAFNDINHKHADIKITVVFKAQPQSELTDTKKVNETINYVFQDEHGNVISSTSREPYSKDLTFNGSRADKNDQFTYPHDKQNFDAVTIAPQTGFDLISAQDAAGNNVLDGKKVKAFNDINHKHADIKITVVFKAQPQSELTDTKKVNETINYVFQDEHGNVISSTSREPYSKDLTFNGSRADKNDQFTYPHDKQNFDAVTIAPQTGFDLISAQDAAGNNVLDGKKVKAFNDINHKHADIKITVVFKAQPQSELTDTKKVNETINYVFQDEHGNVISSTSREPYSKDLTFNGSRADKNDQFTYPHDKQNFDAVTIAPQTGFDLISAQDAAGNNVLDGKKVKAFNDINHKHADIKITVVFKAQPQSELTDTKKVNETINYVFQDEHGNVISSTSREPYSKDLTFNGSRADKNDQFTYPHDKQNFDAVTIAPQTGFDLISAQDAAGNNVLDGKKVKAFNDINHKHADIKITVVFKAQPQSELTDTKKVNETINYVFQDEHGNVISSTSREPYSKDLTFNGSRADKNDQFTYPHDKQNFDAVTIAPQTGFDLISAQDAAGNNVLDGKKVKAFNDINHKHADIKITVVFKAQPQSELTDTKKVNETINYVFQDEHGNVISSTSREPYSKDLTFNGSRADKNDQFTYPHDKQNFDAVTIAPQTGFDLISAQDAAGNNVLDGKKVKAFNDINHKHADIKITVVFKAQPQSELTDTKKVNETINYVFQDEHGNVISSTSREPYSKDLTFNGSRADKNDQFTYPHDKQNFDAVTIAPQTGFDLISAQDAAGNNVLDGKKVKAFNDINHKHADIKITVVFKQRDASHHTPAPDEVATTIHYINVTDSPKTGNYTPSDGTDLNHDITESGKDDDNFPNDLWDYGKDGWTLAETIDPQISNKKLTKGMPTNLYIYLKQAASPVKPPVIPTPPTEPTSPSNPTQPTSPTAPTNPTLTIKTPVDPVEPTSFQPVEPMSNTSKVKLVAPKESQNINQSIHHQDIPNKPNQSNIPNKPEQIVPKASTPANPVPKPSGQTKEETLPQTNANPNQNLGLIGLSLSAISALLGIAADRKRKR